MLKRLVEAGEVLDGVPSVQGFMEGRLHGREEGVKLPSSRAHVAFSINFSRFTDSCWGKQ